MRALHAVLLAALLVLAGAAGADTHVASTGTADPSFDHHRYVEHRGDPAHVAITVPAGETVELRHEQPDGTATMAVLDDGDGRVRLRFDTYEGTWSAAGADEVTVAAGSVERLPPAGTYSLQLNSSDGTATADLTVQPRSLKRVGTWQAPKDATDFDDAAGVRAGIGKGTVTRATAVNASHVLLVQVDASGLAGAIAAADGSNATARFRSVLDEHGDVEVVQHLSTVGIHEEPARLHVLDGPGVEVLPDAGNGTYFVVVDPEAANLTRGDRDAAIDHVTPYDGDGMRFDVTVGLAAASPLTDRAENASAVVAPRRASVSTAPDGNVHLDPATDQTVSGTTNLGTGWNVTVVLDGDDDPATEPDESFRLTREPAVESPTESSYRNARPFEGDFDLSAVPEASRNVNVDVRLDGRSLLDAPVPVTVAAPRASVGVDEIGSDARHTAATVTASLSTGGFIVLHEESANGPVVGHSEYLVAGDHTVTVYVGEPTEADDLVVVAHRDANHNEWFDGPGTDLAYGEGDVRNAIALETPTTNPTSTVASATATGDNWTAPSPTATVDTTVPGPGAVTAVIAVLLAHWVRRRS